MNNLEKKLDNLQELVRLIEKSYNAEQLNLHFSLERGGGKIDKPCRKRNGISLPQEPWHICADA